MPHNIDAASPAGTPPTTLDAFDAEIVTDLLGLGPVSSRIDGFELFDTPAAWPEDLEGAVFFYRGLARLLWERGGNVEAAKSIRRDLQNGRLRAVLGLPHGPLLDLESHRFQGEESRRLWWTARAVVYVYEGPRQGGLDGYVYLVGLTPKALPDPAKAKPMTVNIETQCKIWLESQVQSSPDVRPKSRSDFWTEAKGLFPGLSERAFGRAWGTKTQGTAWAEAGRPRKITAENPSTPAINHRTKITAPK